MNYPLGNLTLDGPFVIYPLKLVIFYSYVTLPEGTLGQVSLASFFSQVSKINQVSHFLRDLTWWVMVKYIERSALSTFHRAFILLVLSREWMEMGEWDYY